MSEQPAEQELRLPMVAATVIHGSTIVFPKQSFLMQRIYGGQKKKPREWKPKPPEAQRPVWVQHLPSYAAVTFNGAVGLYHPFHFKQTQTLNKLSRKVQQKYRLPSVRPVGTPISRDISILKRLYDKELDTPAPSQIPLRRASRLSAITASLEKFESSPTESSSRQQLTPGHALVPPTSQSAMSLASPEVTRTPTQLSVHGPISEGGGLSSPVTDIKSSSKTSSRRVSGSVLPKRSVTFAEGDIILPVEFTTQVASENEHSSSTSATSPEKTEAITVEGPIESETTEAICDNQSEPIVDAPKTPEAEESKADDAVDSVNEELIVKL